MTRRRRRRERRTSPLSRRCGRAGRRDAREDARECARVDLGAALAREAACDDVARLDARGRRRRHTPREALTVRVRDATATTAATRVVIE